MYDRDSLSHQRSMDEVAGLASSVLPGPRYALIQGWRHDPCPTFLPPVARAEDQITHEIGLGDTHEALTSLDVFKVRLEP